jgi:DNA uptake protein ComE-like DNA-binding protein
MSSRLRQLAWASVPIWSLSLLAFAPFLRIAFARRRARDWVVFAGYLAVAILTGVLMSLAGPDDAVSAAAGGLALLVMGVGGVHAFVAFGPNQKEVASGSRASELALTTARARMHRRQQARKLAAASPVLATELRIGRPDLPHEYDDGGLVDVNHVAAEVLASCLGLTPAESQAVVAARDHLGRLGSPEELSAYTELPPDRVEALRDWMVFG